MPEGLNQFLTANHLTLTNYPLQKNELTLKEGERAVLGYFTGPYNAKQAQKTIKDMGFEIAELEPFKPSEINSFKEEDPPSFAQYHPNAAYPFMLTVITDNARASEVAEVMKENGGFV